VATLIACSASILSSPVAMAAFVSAYKFSCNTRNINSTLAICDFVCSFQQALLGPLSTLTVFPDGGTFITKFCTAAATRWPSSGQLLDAFQKRLRNLRHVVAPCSYLHVAVTARTLRPVILSCDIGEQIIVCSILWTWRLCMVGAFAFCTGLTMASRARSAAVYD
jgi:hypothetical protein